MIKKPLVSIIIINWNGGKVFESCLKSLQKISYPNWELIVVDNGSTDNSLEYVRSGKNLSFLRRQESIHIIKNKRNLGFAPANNQGVKIAKGKYILLLNNDTKVTKNFLTLLVSKLESNNSIGAIQPKIFMMDNPGCLDNAGSFFTKIGFLEHWGFGKKDGPKFGKETEIFSAKGACLLIRKDVIKKVGLFDDDFVSYFEESDFCWRVWLSGRKVVYYPKAKIYHKVGFTIKRLDVSNINYHYYKNRINSLIKNLSITNLIVTLPIHLFISAGIAFAFLFRGNPSNFAMISKAIIWNILNLPKTLAKRKKVQKLRKVSDSDFLPGLTKPVNFVKFYGDFKRVEEDIKIKN